MTARWVRHATLERIALGVGVTVATASAASACNPGLLGAVLIPGLFDPCSYDGRLMIELAEIGAPSWGGTTVWRDRTQSRGFRGTIPGGTIEVVFLDEQPETDMALAGTPIELYRGHERIALSSKPSVTRRSDGACGYGHVTSFDLSAIEPGTYSLVHRQASGVNGEVSCGSELCTWESFEGEPALITQLVIPSPDQFPQLTREVVLSQLSQRLEPIEQCYRPAVVKMDPKPAGEVVIVDVRVVADRGYGIAERPEAPGATEPLARCIAMAFDYCRFEARPAEPIVVRYRVAVSVDPNRHPGVHVKATLAEAAGQETDAATPPSQ